jgi:glutamyl-tRNA synthetase
MRNSQGTHKSSPASGGVRFAPSPTGRFHIGNLRTAWISELWASQLGLPWVVRFEDIDQPRVLAGARETQLSDMLALGLKPDLILDQSDFYSRHFELFERAIQEGQIYPCDCSRKEVQVALAGIASAPHDGLAPMYSGHCRHLSTARPFQNGESLAWRFRMPLESGAHDFIVARTARGFSECPTARDSSTFVPSYHWACAIDDTEGCYDLLVRSGDLKPAVVVQRAIARWLAPQRQHPAVFHTSLVVQNDGHRLEKRTAGVTLPEILGGSSAEIAKVVERFSDSFHLASPQSSYLPSKVFGEARDTLSLQQLGF